MDLPVGTLAWGFGDELDDAGRRILDEQRRAGFNAPEGMVVVGLPLGEVRRENVDWTEFQLADGREIDIALTDPDRVHETALKFLLTEKRTGHYFSDKDEPIKIDGVQVRFLNPWDQFPPAQPPWQHKHRDWTWPLAALCIGLVAYALMRSTGWVIDGFAGSRSADIE
jgi:hypothetical protein